MNTVAVFGIGNAGLTDPGVGPRIVAELATLWKFPDAVVIENLAAPDSTLSGRLEAFDAVIFVESIAADAPPGTVQVFRRDEIALQEPLLKEALLHVSSGGTGPSDVTLIGVVPLSAGRQTPSIDELDDAIPFAAEAVLAELNRLGIYARPKTVAGRIRV
jgi:hydrogenase maturation protease